MEEKERWKPLIVRMSKELKKQVRKEARKRKVNMSELARLFISEKLEEERCIQK